MSEGAHQRPIADAFATKDAAFVQDVGTVLPGGYRVDGLLGRGGVADVYAVTGPGGQALALKMLHGHLAHDHANLARFCREADLLSRTHDSHVVGYRSRGVWGRRPFIVTERALGVDLAIWMRNRDCMSSLDAIRVVAGLLSGLAALHACGIVHRDIKPANVFVLRERDQWAVQLIDLGSATALDDAPALYEVDRLTPIGHTIVTPHYACRELLTGAWERDPRGDLYAAAVVLFQLLTGHLPFDHADNRELIRRIVDSPSPPLSVFNAQPAGLSAFVDRALHVDATQRFMTAIEMRAALLSCAAEAAAEAGPGRAEESR